MDDGARVEIRTAVSGTIAALSATVGARVGAGDVVAVVEAMKLEIPIVAEAGGVVDVVAVEQGQIVPEGELVVVIVVDET